MELSNNTILITGGASGIGRALTQALAKRNNKIIICGRNQQKLEQLQSELPEVDVYQCDLQDSQAIYQFSQMLYRKYPALNMLINNAGIQHQLAPSESLTTSEQITSEVTINLLSPMLLTGQLLPLLKQQKNAAIVNISSVLALSPKQSAPVYCATKAAIRNFTQALNTRLAHSNIKVIELMPPLVDTSMTAGRGKGKISTQSFAEQTLKALTNNQQQILIGKAKIFYWLWRYLPSLAQQIVKHS